ncbi:translation initiation factor IF-2 [Candidatus Berkelbacteria bacterium]|nr:translation initiation factor IF-2 [Candidatus Berkelbacteria bacterium]
MARRPRKRKLSKKEQRALTKTQADETTMQLDVAVKRDAVTIQVPTTITVTELARRSGRPATEIVGALLQSGIIATVNDSLDRETVEILADELDLVVQPEEAARKEAVSAALTRDVELVSRPPVVAVMGHVDHGKTTLLDAIRRTDVAAKESGGITQHIGAYQVLWKGKRNSERKITFIDTPGHEAFSALRAHGAAVTDIAILVVAADDGVKPQTKEALSHIRAANVPVVVALTKVDKSEANVDKVRGELAELDLTPEDWGGKTPTVRVASKKGEGVDELLDTILLVADLAELKARSTGPAEAVVIESHMEQGVGPVATILMQHGELSVGDVVVIGAAHGRIRRMEDEHGKRHKTVGPSTPVRIAGISGVPAFGSQLTVVADEKLARELARTARESGPRRTAGSSADENEESALPTLSVVVKADVDGSLAAIVQSLEGVAVNGATVRVIHGGVGDVTESDVNLAVAAAYPLILAFRTGVTVAAKTLARTNHIPITSYDVIYQLIDEVTTTAQRLRRRERVITEIGRLKVLKVFHTTRAEKILGGRIEQGKLVTDALVTIERAGDEVATGRIKSLKRGVTPATEILEGEECGVAVAVGPTVLEGDVLIASVEVEQ